MNPTELIRKKRSGGTLSKPEMEFLVRGYAEGRVPDYQMAAFLMAVYFQKMDFEETALFTDIMLHSGIVVDLSALPGVKVDKHSTGGVGDKVSLILAPMVAACGVPVPMISGRGLGHTGGTLDKLESIPGFRTQLSLEEYTEVLRKVGTAMIGQTKEIAPADKKMYALRDVTGTVESIPLISGSIMSKKLAEGIDALVLDIKTGRGAFMQSEEMAIELARTLIAVGNRFGKQTIGFLTDMSQPLGYAVGNWLEVEECIACMKGAKVDDLMEVTYVLGGAMVMLGKKAPTIEAGATMCREAIASGKALATFRELVKAQGGDVSMIDEPSKYPKSALSAVVKSPSDGFVTSIDALEIGFAGIMLGAGRMRVDEVIDMKAGIMFKKKVGDRLKAGETLATIHTDRKDQIEAATLRVEKAIAVGPAAVKPGVLVKALIDEKGVHPWSR
jgi:pyrimidine-nucleoside phosphorylase